MALDDQHSQDIEDFLDSMKQCFDDVDKALVDVSASIPLEYVESRLVDHFQIVTAWVPGTQGSTGGRPRYNITKEQIETLRETGMNWKKITLCLGISESTLYRRRQEFGIYESFVDISYEELYTVITGMLTQTPYAGESYVSGGLRARGSFVQRYRLREILSQIDPVGRALRRRAAIQRRQYNVKAPNHLWHIDGNHKLVNWRYENLHFTCKIS